MKKLIVEFGPEVPGYAVLNELVRAGKLKVATDLAVQPAKSGKRSRKASATKTISPFWISVGIL